MGRGKISKQLFRALERARHLNKDVLLYDYEVPAVVSGGEVQALIYNCTEKVKVVVRCEGCCGGRQHYRKATPKALSKKGALQCMICLVGAQLPVPAGVKVPHPTEQSFIAMLWQLGVEQSFMFQVVPPCWHRCMDFFNYAAGYCVQVDGSCHWTGMHQHSCEQVLAADFEQALKAVQQGGTLVRIHEADLPHVAVVAETLAAAQGFVGVVLSPGYAHQLVPCQGQLKKYTKAQLTLNPSLSLNPSPQGLIRICKQ